MALSKTSKNVSLKFAAVAVIAVLVVLAVAIGGLLFFKEDAADSLVGVVEDRGGRILGTRVDIARADVAWATGEAELTQLQVANPGGFSDRNMLSVESIEVQADIEARVLKRIDLNGVTALIEFRGAKTNFEVVGDRVADGASGSRDEGSGDEAGQEEESTDAADQGAGSDPLRDEWLIERVAFDRIDVSVRADWTTEAVDFQSRGLVLKNIDGDADALTRRLAFEFLAGMLSEAAGRAVDDRLKESLSNRAGKLRARMEDAGVGAGN